MNVPEPDDRELAAQLRAVPIPPQLVERLQSALVPSDDELDLRLRKVACSSSLVDRLKMIPDDCELDDRLIKVDCDRQFIASLKRIPVSVRSTPRRHPWSKRLMPWGVAIALSWLLVSLGGASFSLWFDETMGQFHNSQQLQLVLVDGPVQLVADQVAQANEQQLQVPLESLVFVSAEQEPNTLKSDSNLRIDWPEVVDAVERGPVGEWFGAVQGGMEPWANTVRMRWGVLGAPHDDRDEVLLDQSIATHSSGIEPPVVPGYNRALWLKYHIFPPLSPATRGLAEMSLPLDGDADNFDRLVQLAMTGRKPIEREVRAEDFVAHALGNMVAEDAGKVGVRTTIAPSPFGPQETKMLQCVVQAGPSVAAPSHLLVALDLSSSMKQNWAEIQRTLCELPDRLGPRDRLSLIAFGEEVELSLEALEAGDFSLWREKIQKLQPAGSADLAEGLRGAVSGVLEKAELPPQMQREVLFISDHEGGWDRSNLESLAQMLQAGVQAGVEINLIDLAMPREDDSTCLAMLAEAASVQRYGKVFIGPRDELQSPLHSWLQMRFPPVASEVSLSMHFNPAIVAAYRLVGHDGSSWSDVMPDAQPLELRPGDNRSVMVELALIPGSGGNLGTLNLNWRDPSTGESVTQKQTLKRNDIVLNWSEAPSWFQRSCLCAEMAEVLRGSRQALRETGWSDTEQHHLSRVRTVLRNSPLDVESDSASAKMVQALEAWRKLGIK